MYNVLDLTTSVFILLKYMASATTSICVAGSGVIFFKILLSAWREVK